MCDRLSRRVFLGGATSLLAMGSISRRAIAREAAVKKLEVDRFIEDLRRASRGKEGQKHVEQVLARAVSEPGSVLQGLGEPSEAGIHTLYRGEDLTVLNVVWAPLMILLPHNHNMWASIGIYTGREDNMTWQRQGAGLKAKGAAALSEKDVYGLPPDAIHSVTNPIRRLTAAIHVYGGDFFKPGRSEWDPETLRERPFDLEAARRTFREANERFKAVR